MVDWSIMGMAYDRLEFDTPHSCASALADRVASELALAVAERKQATLAVSGGKSPRYFFDQLSRADIDWQNIIITLVDERFVDITSPQSNEALVREYLLQHHAAKARFVGLYNKAITAELAAFSAANRIDGLIKPLDVVILGMGEDAHTASFFPGGDRLKQALDPNSRAMVLPMHAKAAGVPRLTMTLPILINARFIGLQLDGQKKMDVFNVALEGDDIYTMPIRAVLKHAAHPVQVYWSPSEAEILDMTDR